MLLYIHSPGLEVALLSVGLVSIEFPAPTDYLTSTYMAKINLNHTLIIVHEVN